MMILSRRLSTGGNTSLEKYEIMNDKIDYLKAIPILSVVTQVVRILSLALSNAELRASTFVTNRCDFHAGMHLPRQQRACMLPPKT